MDGTTALYISAQNGHTEVCSLLIDSGANKDIQQRDGWTALMAAAHFNNYNIVKLLVENNANMDKHNMYGETVLHAAAHFGYASVVKLLVDSGASVLLSQNENTPLHSCFLNRDLSYDQHRKVTVAFMMKDRSIVSIKNKDGKTVIDLYEELEFKKYDTECSSVQKEELLHILKGGPLPAIEFTHSDKSRHFPTIDSEKVYIEALEEGDVEVNLGMVKVIGQERVGKTCLINACLGKEFNKDEEITDAIATFIATKAADRLNKWEENLTDSGSVTEIYQSFMADEIIRKTVEISGGERIDENTSKEKEIKPEMSTEKQQVARAISDKRGSAVETYQKSLTDVVISKTVENLGVERIEETPSEKRKTKPETPTGKVVSAISDKGAGSSKELQMRTKEPRVKIHAFKNETMPTAIQTKVNEGFRQGIYYKKQGMGEWHRVGEETFNIWDYGGQVIYHGMHQVFMTSEAVYIVVFNLNVDLDAKAIVQDSSGRYYTHHLTNLEFILYWIMSVYTHSRQLTDDVKREICLPAIVLTGTHLDSLGANEEERKHKVEVVFKKISDALVGKPYEKHVYSKYFAIENNRSVIDKNVAELKKVLEYLMTALVKTVPLKWMFFQCELQKLRIGKQLLVCPLKEVKDLATKCGIDDEKQHVLLNFLYDLGEIIYMPDNDALKDNVVLDPMGFVDIAKTVITVIPPKWPTAMLRESYRQLDKGILEEKLLRHLWKENEVAMTNFDFFVKLMTRFCLLCERKTSKTPAGARSFFVPLRIALEPPSEEQRQVDSYGKSAISIYHDFCGYYPDELFPQIVTEFIDKFQDEADEPELAHNHAELYFDEDHHVILSVVSFERDRMLMTTILRSEAIDETEKDCEPSSQACTKVLKFLEASFKRSQQGGRRGIQFKRCIPCIYSKNSKKKHMHMLGNFEKVKLSCGRKRMNVERYKQLFGGIDVPDGIVQQDLTTIELLELSKELGTEWQSLAVYLLFSSARISLFKSGNPDNIPTAIFSMLDAWHKNASGVKKSRRSQLTEALRNAGRHDLAEKVESGIICGH